MFNISGTGLAISLICSNTFPVGIYLTHFADDTDAVDFPTIEIGDSAMGVNGDLVVWSTATKIPCTISVIPDSPTDLQLAFLLNANRIGRNKISARDTIQMGLIQGNKNLFTVFNGFIKSGMPANAVTNNGRMKSKPYTFEFENVVGI